jgi:predicted dehydrogenase
LTAIAKLKAMRPSTEKPISLTLKEAAAVFAIIAQLLVSAVAYGRLDQSVTTMREDVREIRAVILGNRQPQQPK